MQNSGFKSIKKTTLADQIINQIKEMIATGVLSVGEQLPPERELATILNVSRLPLREALKALEATHVIKSSYGEGYFVSSLEMDSLVQLFRDANDDVKHVVDDVKEARRMLEISAVKLACERYTKKDIERMQEAIDKMEEDLKNNEPDGTIMDSLQFHSYMVKASHNQLLDKMMGIITNSLYIGRVKTMDTVGYRYKEGINEHREILEAIIKRDVPLAQSLLEKHLEIVY